VDRVLIPVVIRDNQGHALNDLKKGDFQVFDEGKLRAISAFAVERRGAQEANAAGETESGAQQPVDRSAALQSPVLPNRITVFLFDDMHLNFEDAAHCQKAGVNALGDALSGSAMAAVVSTSGKINSGLTQDRAKLEKAIMSLRPEGIYQTDANECPKIDYYQADLIVNKHDATATQDARSQVMTVCDPNAPTDLAARIVDSTAMRVLNLGSQDVLTTYAAIGEYARRMSNLPGERTLILVSSGFMPIDEQARMEESRVLDLAAQSNVVISALDARGLYTASVTASDDTRGRGPGLIAEYRRNSMQLEEEALGELADGTGGSFFHNRNDLDAGLKALAHAPETVYLLELSLDGVKADGKYHDLKIKVDRSGVDIQARRGYFIPKPAKTKK
jgi:VWFA-related protein